MATVSTVDTKTPTQREAQWPAIAALATSVFVPATSARRTQHVSLLRAWAVHFAGAWLLFILILLLVAWSESGASMDPARIGSEFAGLLSDMVHEFDPYPSMILLPALGIALWFEAVLMGIAFVTMSWGAKEERLRTSFASTLRRTWLHIAGVWPLVFVVVAAGVVAEARSSAWKFDNPSPEPEYPRPPTLSPSDPAYQQKLQEYNAAIRDYQTRFKTALPLIEQWRASQPWYVEDWPIIPIMLGFSGALWLLFSGLRAVGAPRASPPVERPPTCDVCGYNLTTMPMESRCPECGEPVAASLGPEVRSGPVWRHRRTWGAWRAWTRCAVDAVIDTPAFGRQLPLRPHCVDHRSFFAVHLPVIFFIGAVAVYVLSVMETPAGGFPDKWAVILAMTSLFGAACVAGTAGVTIGTATLVGVIQTAKAKRNLLPGAMQVACYLTPYLTMWAIFGAVTALIVFKLEETGIFRAAEEMTRYRIRRDTFAFVTWFLPNLAWALWYVVLVVRGTVAMRYANK